MNEPSTFPALPPDVADYSLLIAWHGPEDKPFYRALLVSPSRASLITNQPFWGYAVISAEEFVRLVGILEAQRRPLVAGPYRPNGAEYYVEIEVVQQVYHCSLGFGQETRMVLAQLAAALEPAHQQSIQDIVARISQA